MVLNVENPVIEPRVFVIMALTRMAMMDQVPSMEIELQLVILENVEVPLIPTRVVVACIFPVAPPSVIMASTRVVVLIQACQ